MSEGMKTCTGCGMSLPNTREFFHIKNSGGELRAKCKPCENQRKREYRKANAEHVRALDRALYAKVPHADRERNKRYNQQNPEVAAARRRRRRALTLKSQVSPYKDFDVLQRYGTECHLCGEQIDLLASRRAGIEGWERGLHVDHLVPISANGPDSLENVRPSHGKCNVVRGPKPL